MGRSVDDTDNVHWYLRELGIEFANLSTAQMSLIPLPTFKDLVPKAEALRSSKSHSGSSPLFPLLLLLPLKVPFYISGW